MLDSGFSPALAWSWVFALLLTSSLVLKLWLASRNMRHVARHRGAVPAPFAAHVTLGEHQKAADYTLAQGRLGVLELAWDSTVVLGWTLLGALQALHAALQQALGTGLIQQVALVAAFTTINALLGLPWSAWRTFVLEERFGFNRMRLGLWLADLAKSTLLGALLGLPFIALVLWLMQATGTWWWLWTWGVWMGFNLFLLLVYPTWIAPWFNQFKPLDDPQLQQRVQSLMQRCGFQAKGFYVMDGSRRSAHANAYFTGLGRSKRVVFYDTLLQQLQPEQVDAVLAHELGHFAHRHVLQRMVLMFGMSLGALALLGWLAQQTWFYTGLGVEPSLLGAHNAQALLLFLLVLPQCSSFISPWLAAHSRRHEFQADAYAARHAQPQALVDALLQLYKDNASTLTPDPLYARFYYSHPPASERIGQLLSHA
ncbi:MAG: M48 family metallopeptidase [Rhodoferax sp.]